MNKIKISAAVLIISDVFSLVVSIRVNTEADSLSCNICLLYTSIGMLAICVVAAFLIEIIRHKFPQYEMCIRDSYNIICLYVNFRL